MSRNSVQLMSNMKGLRPRLPQPQPQPPIKM
jgi:hypothetical protein